MKKVPYFLAAYWGAREESNQECAHRLKRMLTMLSRCDSRFSTWYEHTASRKRALQNPIYMDDHAYLLDLLNRCRIRNDEHEVMQGAGCLISLWNGQEKENGVTLTISCGCSSDLLRNNVVIELAAIGDLNNVDQMYESLKSVCVSWEPEWGCVFSKAAIAERHFNTKEPFVDWQLYLSKNFARHIPPFVDPARANWVGNAGFIVVVQPEPPDPANSDHLQNILNVEFSLRAAIA